jgi:hypothetical protein
MKHLIAISLCFLTLHCGAETHGGEYFHVPQKRPTINIKPSEKFIAIGDLAYDAEYCESSNPMYCFKLQKFSFAAPKQFNTLKTWKHDGQDYKIVHKLSTRGEYPAWVIEKTTGQRWWYLWSSHKGLMAFGEKMQDAGSYLLDGECGFGANTTCADEPK